MRSAFVGLWVTSKVLSGLTLSSFVKVGQHWEREDWKEDIWADSKLKWSFLTCRSRSSSPVALCHASTWGGDLTGDSWFLYSDNARIRLPSKTQGGSFKPDLGGEVSHTSGIARLAHYISKSCNSWSVWDFRNSKTCSLYQQKPGEKGWEWILNGITQEERNAILH